MAVVARPREGSQGHLIRHGPGGKPEGSFLAEQRGDFLLETIDGRVFSELIVTHRRLGDRRRIFA